LETPAHQPTESVASEEPHHEEEQDVESLFTIPTHGPFKMFVGNLKFSVTDQDLDDFFTSKGAKVSFLKVLFFILF
jgi:RNA recognition motif-containing protein